MLFSKLFINISKHGTGCFRTKIAYRAVLVVDIEIKKLEVRRFTLAIQVSSLNF